MRFKIGSLFDGSGGFPLAGSICGVEPCWASEIEPYPIAVTRERFPTMKHLGDISKINGAEVEPVDIITFGSPCQDLSVAGKRAGLKHEANGDEETTRSGLFMEAVRIIKEMREATDGKYPRFALWENVPGAFSSNRGEDFRIVCEEICKVADGEVSIPRPDKGKWEPAGLILGEGYSVAWRTFDAQYWGVPQRRRRIHLVVDFRGKCAREVLFELQGVRWYFTKGGKAWQGTAADAEGGIGADDRDGAVFPVIAIDKESYSSGEGFNSLASNSMKSSNPHSGCRRVEVGKTLDCTDPNHSKNQGGIAVVQRIEKEQHLFENHSQDTRYKGPLAVSPMLPAQLGTGGNNTPFVVEQTPFCKSARPRFKGDAPTYIPCKVSNTLNTFCNDPCVVAYPCNWNGEQVTGTLTDNNAGGNQRMPDKENFNAVICRDVECYRQGGFADYVEGEVGTLKASGGDLGGGK